MNQRTATMPSRNRLEGLDVLRGAAIGLVMLCHTWPQTFDGAGIAGVVIFFVLSGYLITGLLQREMATHGSIRWSRFYMHRFLRLFPALALMLGVVAAVTLVTGSASGVMVAQSVTIGLIYLGDLPLTIFEPISPLNHLWTLSVEEQFYLFWPALLLFATRMRRVGTVLVVASVLSLMAAPALPMATNLTTWQIYKSPTSWAIAMLLGCAAQIYSAQLTHRVRGWMVATAACTVAGTAVIPHLPGHPQWFVPLGPVLAVAGAVLVLAATGRRSVTRAEKPVLWLGMLSYGAYLWNAVLTECLRPDTYHNLSLLTGLALCAATVGCAVVSWFTVEALGRCGRARYDRRRARSQDAVHLPAPRREGVPAAPVVEDVQLASVEERAAQRRQAHQSL